MKREIIITEDGSSTILMPEWNECYHSTHGAVSESNHIFIEAGLKYILSGLNDLQIFEIGFGTGLNAFLTAMNIMGSEHTIYYMGVEPYPLTDVEIAVLNYPETSGFKGHKDNFKSIHNCEWEKLCPITPNFRILKKQLTISEIILPQNHFNLVYFDAFAPTVQPELWSKDVFEKINSSMKIGGILVTYSSKGDVKRALKESGFTIEKLAGPKGKREFIRATKTI